MIKKKALCLWFTFVVMAGLMVLSSLPTVIQAAGKDIKIGVVTSFKMECGTSTLKAAEMAAEEINAQGGVLGRKIKIVSADSESDTEKGIMALKRLVERDKVDILLGGARSGVVLGQMEYLKGYNTIYLAVGPSSPLIAKKVAEVIANGSFERGILICSTGIGMSIAANKVRGVRAALCYDAFSARRARQHNDANILCLGAGLKQDIIPEIVQVFLDTDFEGGRHSQRVDKIKAMEG